MTTELSQGGDQLLLGDVFKDQGEDEMGVDPCSCEFLAPGGQAVQVQDAFQALEGDFDLPPVAIQGQSISSGQCGAVKAILRKRGAWFLFLPPDSPDLNPIEMAPSVLLPCARTATALK